MKDIIAAVRSTNSSLAEGTLYQYLNYAAKHDNSSGIISLGPYKGYYLDEAAMGTAAELAEASEEEERQEQQRDGSIEKLSHISQSVNG